MRRNTVTIAGLALAALVALACSSGSSDDKPATTDKYKQTWSKKYGDTTCADWTDEMTKKERWVAAADMLSAARSKAGAKGLPDDALVDTFEGGITNVCSTDVAKAQRLAEVGAMLYLTETSTFGPSA